MAARLDLFRSYFKRLDPEDAGTLRDELYVEPPNRAVGDQLAARFQLAPTSSHLIVGGVGAGKTTQMVRAANLLSSTGDMQARYVDVSRNHDLGTDLNGVLTVLTGLALAKVVKGSSDAAVAEAAKQFRKWANGYREFVPYDPADDEPWPEPDDDHEPGHYVPHPGVIKRPLPPLPRETEERIEALEALKLGLPADKPHFVVLFDSLDRLGNVDSFRKAVIEDVRAIRLAGIGLAVVGPAGVVYGSERPIVDLFDQLHSVPAIDVASDTAGREFLDRVLARRTDDTVLSPQIRQSLVRWSGGILRDLLGLTRSAVEEAFVAGADAVAEEHVVRAVDQFGRAMMIGLRERELETLQRLRTRGTFVATDDDELALLESRRVVEYPGVRTHYAVHPTIAPLLASLDKGKK